MGARGAWSVVFSVLASVACASAPADSSQAPVDHASPASASGASDAGVSSGSSLVDAGGGGADANAAGEDAATDAAVDAPAPRADVPAIACGDAPSDVYVTPPGLAPMTMAARGAIVRCAPDFTLSASDAASELASGGTVGVTTTTGTSVYRIAYRTYRDDGVPGVATALVYLPSAPRSVPLPLVVLGHPTVGLAPGCAPSETQTADADLALPWAANGYAVIKTDYAGLGNEGVQGYVDNHDEAHSLLDSARALRGFLDPRALDDRVLLVGHSQGGGAVLAAQGLAKSYGAGGNVVGAIVFAPEYFERLDSFGYVAMMRAPTDLTIATGISRPVVAALRDYAFAYNVLGASSATTTFPSGEQTGMGAAVMTLCQTPFGGYVQGAATHVGDIFDPSFTAAFLGCVDGTSACAGTASTLYDWLEADLVAPDPAGAPVLYVQGLADVIMPADQEGACNVQSLESAGVSVQLCVDPSALHTNVVERNVATAIAWADAKLWGGSTPTCSSAGMPACAP